MKPANSNLNRIMLAMILTCLVPAANGQYQIRSYDLFCNAVNMPGDDHGRSIINRIDDGYAIAGYSYASTCGIGPQDWMFIKLKSNGSIDTVRLIGFITDDKCNSLIQSPTDSGYVLAGYMQAGDGKLKASLVKLNKSAGLMYSKRIDNSYKSQYNQVVRNYADKWTLAGFSEQFIAENKVPYKILVTNYSSAGVRQWGYKYVTLTSSGAGNAFNDAANSVCFQGADSSYCVAAKTSYYSGNNSNCDIMIMKVSMSGIVRWNRIYRFDLDPAPNYYTSAVPRKIIALPDGGFVVVGSTNVNSENETDIIVMKVTSTGSIVWSRIYGNLAYNEYGESIVYDGELIVTGARRKVTLPFDVIVMKITTAGGALLWVKRWDVNNPADYGYDIVKSNTGAPGGYAITGDSYRGGMPDPFLMRLNAAGQVEGQACMETITMSTSTKAQQVDSVSISRVPVTDLSWTPNIVTPPSRVNDICVSAGNQPGSPENAAIQPGRFSLDQNYPNPFNPSTVISYQLSVNSFVTLKIFDITGKEAGVLVNQRQDAGRHEIVFNANNLSSGVYVYKLTVTNLSNSNEIFTETRKMLLIR